MVGDGTGKEKVQGVRESDCEEETDVILSDLLAPGMWP